MPFLIICKLGVRDIIDYLRFSVQLLSNIGLLVHCVNSCDTKYGIM